MTQVSVTLVQNSLVSKKYLETIKALDGQLFHLKYHQWRLNSALESQNRYKLEELLKAPKNGLHRCRVVYDDKTFEVEYIPYIKRQIQSLKLVECDTIEYSKKYEDRSLLNNLFSQREQCDDILIVKNGLLCDTSIANIAFFDGQKWLTPKIPLLKGTTRERYLREGFLIEKEIAVEDIKNYKKVALLNAMIDFDIITQDNSEDIIC